MAQAARPKSSATPSFTTSAMGLRVRRSGLAILTSIISTTAHPEPVRESAIPNSTISTTGPPERPSVLGPPSSIISATVVPAHLSASAIHSSTISTTSLLRRRNLSPLFKSNLETLHSAEWRGGRLSESAAWLLRCSCRCRSLSDTDAVAKQLARSSLKRPLRLQPCLSASSAIDTQSENGSLEIGVALVFASSAPYAI